MIHCCYIIISQSVQSLSHVWLFATPWTAACKASLSITNSQSLLKLMFIESVMPSNHLIFCNPLLLLLSIFPIIRVISTESFSSVQFSHSVMSDYLRPHKSQHTRPPCPSPTPGVHSDSFTQSSQWCHPAISSSCPLLLLPPIPPSIRVLSSESTLRMKYWSFSFSISPSN